MLLLKAILLAAAAESHLRVTLGSYFMMTRMMTRMWPSNMASKCDSAAAASNIASMEYPIGMSQEYTVPWDIPSRSHIISFSWDGIPPSLSHINTIPWDQWDGISRRIYRIFPATTSDMSVPGFVLGTD